MLEGIKHFGFDPQDLRLILHSHGHIDHLGATKDLVNLTGARTLIGAPDAPLADGTVDLTWARELGTVYTQAFTPDVLLHDGDTVTLGQTCIKCVSTPGHTEGTMSFFFDVTDGQTTCRAGMHGGVGINSMKSPFLTKYGLSFSCRENFLRGLDKVENEHVDIFIGNHVGNNHTEEKIAQKKTGGDNPFIDPTEWKKFICACRNRVQKLMEEDPVPHGYEEQYRSSSL